MGAKYDGNPGCNGTLNGKRNHHAVHFLFGIKLNQLIDQFFHAERIGSNNDHGIVICLFQFCILHGQQSCFCSNIGTFCTAGFYRSKLLLEQIIGIAIRKRNIPFCFDLFSCRSIFVDSGFVLLFAAQIFKNSFVIRPKRADRRHAGNYNSSHNASCWCCTLTFFRGFLQSY